MDKRNLLFTVVLLCVTSIHSMDVDQYSAADSMQTVAEVQDPIKMAEDAINKEIKKNEGQLKKIRENEKLSRALEIIEPKLKNIINTAGFTSVVERMATKEAQDIAEGKTFSEVKYAHSLSTDFPNLINPNKFLAWVYSLLANIAHYQLLLNKLSNAKQATLPVESESTTVGS